MAPDPPSRRNAEAHGPLASRTDRKLISLLLSALLFGPQPVKKESPRQRKSLRGLHLGMGLGRFERPTSRLSGVRSNQLSYRPAKIRDGCPYGSTCELAFCFPREAYSRLQKGGDPAAGSPTATLLRLRPSHRARLRRLPPLRVGSPTSGAPDSHGVTGGVYKARERIHRGVADPRLLAIPASCSRVTDCNPNLDQVFAIRSASRHRCALSWPL